MLFEAFNINALRNFESSQHFLNGSVVVKATFFVFLFVNFFYRFSFVC